MTTIDTWRQLFADPSNLQPQNVLLFADWLESRGCSDEAEFVWLIHSLDWNSLGYDEIGYQLNGSMGTSVYERAKSVKETLSLTCCSQEAVAFHTCGGFNMPYTIDVILTRYTQRLTQ